MTSCVCGTQWHHAQKMGSQDGPRRRKLLILNGTDRSRTDDLLSVNQAIFQLSYDPNFNSCSLLWFDNLCQEMSAR